MKSKQDGSRWGSVFGSHLQGSVHENKGWALASEDPECAAGERGLIRRWCVVGYGLLQPKDGWERGDWSQGGVGETTDSGHLSPSHPLLCCRQGSALTSKKFQTQDTHNCKKHTHTYKIGNRKYGYGTWLLGMRLNSVNDDTRDPDARSTLPVIPVNRVSKSVPHNPSPSAQARVRRHSSFEPNWNCEKGDRETLRFWR